MRNASKNCLKFIQVSILVFSMAHSGGVHANSFFNGSCTSQSDWVTSALSQAESVLEAMRSLKEDPNCTGIESVIQSFKPVSDLAQGSFQTSGPLVDIRKLSREISDLRMMSQDGNASFRGRVMDVLMNRVSDEAEKKAEVEGVIPTRSDDIKNIANSLNSISARTAVAMDTLAAGVNETLKVLPNLQSCFNNRPDQGMAITSGIVRLMGAFVDGGEGVTSRFGTVLANYVSYARNQEFAISESQIREKEYWSSMSCMIESSAEAYCSAKDASAILDDQKERRLEDRTDDPNSSKSQLRGYHLLVRELPRISNWLQMVLNGLRPQMQSQAEFQESVVESINNLIKDKLALEGTYAQELLTYKQTYLNSKSPDIISAKRAGVVELVTKLIYIMYGRARDGAQNFFVKVRPQEKAYFFLLNMNFPEELTKADAIMSPTTYLERNLDNIPELRDPDSAILKIEDQIEEMLGEAMVFGTNYFTTWFIPDPSKVVDEALAIEPPNIYQSFRNINRYLDSVIIYYIQNRDRRIGELEENIARLSVEVADDKSKYGELNRAKKVLQYFKSPTIYASIIDTRKRITTVLDQFKKRDELFQKIAYPVVEDFFDDKGGIDDSFFTSVLNQESCIDIPLATTQENCEDNYSEQIKVIDRNLLEIAFDQFNVMLQRDTFLNNRFFSYILSEYMERVQSGEEEDLYLRDLLAVTGRNIIDKLVSINRLNPNNARLDLAQAIPINFENLESIEQLFAQDLKIAICKVVARTGGDPETLWECGIRDPRCEELGAASRRRLSRRGGWNSRNQQYSAEGVNCHRNHNAILNEDIFEYGSRLNLISKDDDELGYYGQLRAKYCVQALAFPTKWSEFETICKGTELVSQFAEEAEYDEVKVNYSYDEFTQGSNTSDRICALRDYIRRNQVFWLLNKDHAN